LVGVVEVDIPLLQPVVLVAALDTVGVVAEMVAGRSPQARQSLSHQQVDSPMLS
jgi:hypothetical protein